MLALLGLGSNREFSSLSPVELLAAAIREISLFASEVRLSSVYRSGAMYVEEQDDFYNMALLCDYQGTPQGLLGEIHSAEGKLGRDRSREIRNGPRSVDIDIELFGALSVTEPNLVIPHERMEERAFVLVPALELMEKYAEDVEGAFPHSAEFYRRRLDSLSGQRISLFMGVDELSGICSL